MRVALSNEILVNGYSPSYSTVDTIPPSPILTLVLAETSSNNSFTLLWRAVGDDYDSGKGKIPQADEFILFLLKTYL